MSRGAIWALALLAGLMLVVVLAVTLPARVAWSLLAANYPQAQLSGLSGTLWNGQAEQLSVNRQALGKLTWQLQPVSLLRGAPRVSAQLAGPTLQMEMRLLSREDGAIELSGLQARADAAWLAPALGIPLLIPTGRLEVDFTELVLLPGGLPERADGNIRWLDAGVSGLAQTSIGAVEFTALGRDRQISGEIRNLGPSPLLIAGNYALTGTKYQSEVKLRAENSDPTLVQMLKYVGEPSPDGGRLLKIQGEILVPQ